jgi:hypothetical protein
MLDDAMLRDITSKMVTPAARREAVAHLRVAHEVSERRACCAPGIDGTPVRTRSRRRDDAVVRARLRELAAIRRRLGYGRLHILLWREGIVMNHKRLRRLYREEWLQVRRRSGRKRALGTRASWQFRKAPTSAGVWTSCPMRSSMVAVFAFWRSSTTLTSPGQSTPNTAPPGLSRKACVCKKLAAPTRFGSGITRLTDHQDKGAPQRSHHSACRNPGPSACQQTRSSWTLRRFQR